MSRPGFPISMHESRTVHNNYHAAGGGDFPGTDTCSIRFRDEDKIGSNTPGWPAVVQTNDYTRSASHWSQEPLTVNGSNSANGDTFDGQWGDAFGLGYDPTRDNVNFSQSSEISDVRYKLINKLISSISYGKMNFGELIATRQQASDMAIDAMNRIRGSFTKLSSGNVSGAIGSLTGGRPPRGGGSSGGGGGGGGNGGRSGRITSLAGGVPSKWLALQYGWKPLLSNVYDSLELCRQAWNDNGEVKTAVASARSTTGPKTLQREYNGQWGPRIDYKSSNRKVSGRAQIKYRIANMFVHNLSQTGLLNPAALAWELLPYSFVVDWFIPIGPWLASLDYSAGLSFEEGWLSYKCQQSYQSKLGRRVGTMGTFSANWSGGTGSGEGFFMSRERLGGFPTPPLPKFKDPFSPLHLANALSLLSEAFSRR